MEGMKDLANLDFLPFETNTIIGITNNLTLAHYGKES